MKNYTLKVYKNNGKVEIVRTRKQKRFSRIIRTINWQIGIKKAYVKVSYGKYKCSKGCVCEFYNDGYCNSKKELLDLLEYFDEEN